MWIRFRAPYFYSFKEFAAYCGIVYNLFVQEYLSEAIVLNKEANGDLDIRVAFFTKKFGKLKAKAKSARKITSKLSGHLEPGFLSQVRLVEKNGLQVVDALKKSFLDLNLPDLRRLEKILAEGEPDHKIWHMLAQNTLDWEEILKILGWDPAFAHCSHCGKSTPALFDSRNQEFFCRDCLGKFQKEHYVKRYAEDIIEIIPQGSFA